MNNNTRSALFLILRILNVVFLILFLLAVVVQYNDPDPIPWMLVYGAATVACVMSVRRVAPRWLTIVTALVALAWSAFLLPRVLGQVAPGELFRETGMATLEIEEAREMIGLLLVALWMLILAFVMRTRSMQR